MTPPSRVIAIDGPGGSGKSTVSREVARRLGIAHLDTGAFYRAATLAALRSDVDLDDEEAVLQVVEGISITQEDGRTILDGEDVSEQIRTDAVTAGSSAVAVHPAVRRELVEKQREWVANHPNGAAVEGRDVGSVVLPDADVKVYLTADPAERARRRALETGTAVAQVEADLARRDTRDTLRAASPLIIAEGAVVIDTTGMSIDEVVGSILDLTG